MNYNDELKVLWFTPMRTGTRSSGEVMKFYNFEATQSCPDHASLIPRSKRDYYLICNVRNPYSRFVSLYYMFLSIENYYIEFEDWVKSDCEKYRKKYCFSIHEETPKNPDHIVRMETFAEDIKSIFFVDLNDSDFMRIFENNIQKNNFIHEHSNRINGKFWKEYYNQQLADLVYEKTAKDFKSYNYNINSWK